jgi:acetoin utilization deacetylase AcuC-like enzyme
MPAGTDSMDFRQCYADRVFPMLHKLKPQHVLISASFHGHCLDPLAE